MRTRAAAAIVVLGLLAFGAAALAEPRMERELFPCPPPGCVCGDGFRVPAPCKVAAPGPSRPGGSGPGVGLE